jgi:MoxR-like ATPase
MTFFDPTTTTAKTRYQKAVRLDGKTDEKYAPYQYAGTQLRVAVNAALAARRPLLLRGEAGAGKSTLAYDVAVVLGWSYYERVVSSRMAATDLLWQYDAIERLNDASDAKRETRPMAHYVRAQTLWWVLAPESAKQYRPGDADPVRVPGKGGRVLLLDEIDKADPDLPNDLLVPLGEGRFRVPEIGANGAIEGSRDNLLVVITTNGERELPAPFLRRCVCQVLATPGPDQLEAIAKAHFPQLSDKASASSAKRLIARMLEIRRAVRNDQHRPGTAEILDALRACLELGIDEDHSDWNELTLAMGWKNPEPAPEAIGGPSKASS